MTDRELLESIATEIKEMKSDIKLIKTQQSEHGEILQSVRHSQESQVAQIDQIQITVAHIEGDQKEMDKTMNRMAGDVSFLVRKAADHDEDIRELRRAK